LCILISILSRINLCLQENFDRYRNHCNHRCFGYYVFSLAPKGKIVSQEPTQNGESAIPASLPSQTEPSGNLENVEKARKVFENIIRETISDKTKKDGSKEVDFKDQKGNPISLSDFENALGVEVYPKLQEYLNDGYQVFYCPGKDGEKRIWSVSGI